MRTGKAANLAVRQLDAFEERWGGPCYFQAYEFVENGSDLQHVLDAEREKHRATRIAPIRDPQVWARHVTCLAHTAGSRVGATFVRRWVSRSSSSM